MESIQGTMDEFPVTIMFHETGIRIVLGLVYFTWDQLSPLQQKQIMNQIDSNERNLL